MAFAASEDGAYCHGLGAMTASRPRDQCGARGLFPNYRDFGPVRLRPMLLPVAAPVRCPRKFAAEPTTPPSGWRRRRSRRCRTGLSSRRSTEVLTLMGPRGFLPAHACRPIPLAVPIPPGRADTEFPQRRPLFRRPSAVGGDGSWVWVCGRQRAASPAQQIRAGGMSGGTPMGPAPFMPTPARRLPAAGPAGQVSMAFEPAGLFHRPGDRAPFRAFAHQRGRGLFHGLELLAARPRPRRPPCAIATGLMSSNDLRTCARCVPDPSVH